VLKQGLSAVPCVTSGTGPESAVTCPDQLGPFAHDRLDAVSTPADHSGDRPIPLAVGAGLTALEGLVLSVYAVLELASVDADRVSVAVTTGVFFGLMGGALVLCASGLWRGHSWARSPVVVAQLITLLTAFSFLGGETTWVAVVLAAVSIAVLVCVLHPRSIAALAADGS